MAASKPREWGAALLTTAGNVYTGVCFDAACGLGFCAEHAAVAAMLQHREWRVVAAVAVGGDGQPVPPCGRCRELLHQLSPANLDALVLIAPGDTRPLRDLLPAAWHYRG
jgi:cytidine deaminase